jgi:hypothetical protein
VKHLREAPCAVGEQYERSRDWRYDEAQASLAASRARPQAPVVPTVRGGLLGSAQADVTMPKIHRDVYREKLEQRRQELKTDPTGAADFDAAIFLTQLEDYPAARQHFGQALERFLTWKHPEFGPLWKVMGAHWLTDAYAMAGRPSFLPRVFYELEAGLNGPKGPSLFGSYGCAAIRLLNGDQPHGDTGDQMAFEMEICGRNLPPATTSQTEIRAPYPQPAEAG